MKSGRSSPGSWSKPGGIFKQEEEERGVSPAINGLTVSEKERVLYRAEDTPTALTALVLAHSVYSVQFARGARNLLFYIHGCMC